ncbi:hypothetical protein GCM10023317_31160 [Actinopolymorpha pittospori]
MRGLEVDVLLVVRVAEPVVVEGEALVLHVGCDLLLAHRSAVGRKCVLVDVVAEEEHHVVVLRRQVGVRGVEANARLSAATSWPGAGAVRVRPIGLNLRSARKR